MRPATIVLVLVLTSVSVARADPVRLTVTGIVTTADPAEAERHLGFPIFPGFRFVYSATIQQAGPDQDSRPDIGIYYLESNPFSFVFAPESFASEYTGRSRESSDHSVVDGSGADPLDGGDNIVFGIFSSTTPIFDSFLSFSGPASWLNSDAFAVSRLATPLPISGNIQGLCATAPCVGESVFMNGNIDTISLSPAATPEPASMVLIGTGLLVLGGRRWRRQQSTPPHE